MGRLTTSLWVSAYLQRLQLEAIPVYVTRKGDKTAGAVLVKCVDPEGHATVHERMANLLTGQRRWEQVSEGAEAEIDAMIERQCARDPDLWVVEVEMRDGRNLLDDPGLSA